MILNKSGSFLHCVNLVGLQVIRCHQLLIAGNLPNGMRGRSQITSALPCAFQSLPKWRALWLEETIPLFKKQDVKQWINLIQEKPEDLPHQGGLQYLVITFTLNWMVSFCFCCPASSNGMCTIFESWPPQLKLLATITAPTTCSNCQQAVCCVNFNFTLMPPRLVFYEGRFFLEPMNLESLLPQNKQLTLLVAI